VLWRLRSGEARLRGKFRSTGGLARIQGNRPHKPEQTGGDVVAYESAWNASKCCTGGVDYSARGARKLAPVVELAAPNSAKRKRICRYPTGLGFADDAGRTSNSEAALATVTSLANLDERTLVQEAQVGNRAAFEELVRRYDRTCCGWLST